MKSVCVLDVNRALIGNQSAALHSVGLLYRNVFWLSMPKLMKLVNSKGDDNGNGILPKM